MWRNAYIWKIHKSTQYLSVNEITFFHIFLVEWGRRKILILKRKSNDLTTVYLQVTRQYKMYWVHIIGEKKTSVLWLFNNVVPFVYSGFVGVVHN